MNIYNNNDCKLQIICLSCWPEYILYMFMWDYYIVSNYMLKLQQIELRNARPN